MGKRKSNSKAGAKQTERRAANGKITTASADRGIPEQVQRVRAALANGTYSPDALMDAAVDRMLSGICSD